MQLEEISLYHFKNYETYACRFNQPVVAFIGPNGVGKTNLLDAIFFLCYGQSFLVGQDRYAIKEGSEDGLRVAGTISNGEGEHHLSITMRKGRAKRIEWNGQVIRKRSQYIGRFPVVMIAPSDQALVAGPPAGRRRYMDHCIASVEPDYIEARQTYDKIIKQRNALLKKEEHIDRTLLSYYDEQLEEPAHAIFEFRKAWCVEITPYVQSVYAQISHRPEQPQLAYESPLWDMSMKDWLAARADRDRILGRTTKGIHRDDLALSILGRDARTFASQGQQKTLVFALKLAQFAYLREQTGQTPILLLDDVFDKLDANRSGELLQVVAGLEAQVFLSHTNEDLIAERFKNLPVSLQIELLRYE